MVSRTRFKSILTGLALYTLAGLIVGYFWINAFTGKYGLNAQQELDQEIVTLTDDLTRLKAERSKWERHVALLRSDRLDPDMLDERARAQLEFVHPRDLIMTVPPAASN
jgi:cell division protein FtsB